jgi:predicted dehydrogenase
MQMTRRTAIAGGVALAAAGAPTPVRLPRPIRVGLIEFDGHAGEITGQLKNLPDVELAAVCAKDQKVLARQGRSPLLAKAAQYSDYNQMLDREKLDVVAVCNNNGERAEAVLACTRRNINVIAEKPLAITRADYDKVRKSVLESRVSLGMLLPMRYDPPYKALRQIVADGLVGEVTQIGSQKSYKLGTRPEWFRKRSTYGSTILWIGIHMIDLMRWTSGREFVQAAGFQSKVGPEVGDMETVSASVFQLDNGGVAALRMDYFRPETAATHGDDRVRLAGTKGVAEYMAATGVTLITQGEKPRVLTELPPAGSVFVDYLQATYNGKAPTLTLQEIWRVNEITLAAHEAAESGRIVRA